MMLWIIDTEFPLGTRSDLNPPCLAPYPTASWTNCLCSWKKTKQAILCRSDVTDYKAYGGGHWFIPARAWRNRLIRGTVNTGPLHWTM
jgi:hypothetical protein